MTRCTSSLSTSRMCLTSCRTSRVPGWARRGHGVTDSTASASRFANRVPSTRNACEYRYQWLPYQYWAYRRRHWSTIVEEIVVCIEHNGTGTCTYRVPESLRLICLDHNMRPAPAAPAATALSKSPDPRGMDANLYRHRHRCSRAMLVLRLKSTDTSTRCPGQKYRYNEHFHRMFWCKSATKFVMKTYLTRVFLFRAGCNVGNRVRSNDGLGPQKCPAFSHYRYSVLVPVSVPVLYRYR